ncbi:Ig-like domain-containing protein [Alloalcanivorax venustensis]|uniref:Ig-like domain-containing protein n=4 Tax=Alloalcanivorax venustensis TaxID=172371 RepID=UPI003299CB38
MDMRKLIVLTGTAILAACGGSGSDEQTVSFDNWQETEVVYSYPFDGQAEVSPNAPVVVRFSDPVDVDASNFTLTGPDGAVGLTVRSADEGRSAVLMPDDALAVKSEYALTLNNIRTDSGDAALPDGSVDFTTRAALAGKPRALRQLSDSFEVASVSPDGDDLPFLDFSSVNLVMTQPLDRQTVVYGDTVTLTQNGQTVPAQLRVDGRQISIDPEQVLEPGTEVTLDITNGVRNLYGEAFGGFTRTFSPRDTKPRETLVQEAAPADPVLGCLDQGVQTSPITGDPINCVPLIAKLLGDNTVSKQQGNVFAELGFAPNFPDKTPLRVPKGSLLKGDPLDVRIGGEVPAGFDSGEVTVTFLGDANGYLLPNPYSDDPSAPKQLRLTMDVAFDTEVQRANGAFNQTLLQVELVGYAIADTSKGSLIVDAVGVVEPEVLGTETAYGVLSFHMESYPDQPNAPEMEVDMSSPELAAWQPGEHANKQRPGDPIILNFSEPLDPTSVIEGDTLRVTADGNPVDFEYYLDGVSVVIQPQPSLQHNTDYQVQFTDGITDIAGNPAQGETLSFTLPTYIGSGHPAIATTTYPGFPCAVDKSSWDIANGDHGICRGGEGDDDHLPVMPMPAERAIEVQFSQVMDEDSIILGETCDSGSFRVEKIADAGQAPQQSGNNYVCQEAVPGEIEYNARTVTFIPDQPWEDGATYRYVLMSENQDFTPANCTSGEAICTEDQGPFQTALLEAPTDDMGGPNLEIYFTGAPANDNVFQVLRNLPTFDVNGDTVHQDSEPQPQPAAGDPNEYPVPKNSTELFVKDTGGLLLDARVGCDYDGPACPQEKFIHVTAALDVEVVGYDAQEDAVRVNIYPTLLQTSSVDVYARLLLVLFPIDQIIATGPQIMRIRYQEDGNGNRNQPVTGWIRETPEGPVFETSLDIYLSAPYLEPSAAGLTLSHDLYSYPLSLDLVGDVTFLDDGRLQIEQRNQAEQDVEVSISLDDGGVIKAADMTLGIPEGGVFLNYISTPIKP